MQNFTGEQIGHLKLDELLSDGLFAQVYRASDVMTDDAPCVVKLVKPGMIEPPARGLPEERQAVEEITGAVVAASPDPRALLEYQMSLTESVGAGVFPQFRSWLEDTDRQLFGCAMELIDGPTLRQLIDQGRATLDHVISAAEALQRLLEYASHHGDLKPTNVIFDGTQARLLDPGFYGNLKSSLGGSHDMKVTTPLYYPWLKPDDLLALGLITWEVVFGKHPLKYDESFTGMNISSQLKLILRTKESCGQFYLAPIVNLPSPGRLRPMDRQCENLLLKLIHLTLTESEMLDVDAGFERIKQVIEALRTIRSSIG